MVKVKKDHEALEEWFPQAAYTSPATSDIHNCQLNLYLQFEASCCIAHACCSAPAQSLLCSRAGITVSSGQSPLLWKFCRNLTSQCENPRGKFYLGITYTAKNNRQNKQRHPQKSQEIKNKDKGTFRRNKQLGYFLLQTKGYKLFGGLLSLPSAARCKTHSTTFVSNKTSLSGMQLWRYRQWIYMRRAPSSSFYASLADFYKLNDISSSQPHPAPINTVIYCWTKGDQLSKG